MNISDYCRSYFDGIYNFKQNFKESPVKTVLKVASLFTVIIPLAALATLALSSLFGRAKPDFTSKETEKVSDVAKNTLDLNATSDIAPPPSKIETDISAYTDLELYDLFPPTDNPNQFESDRERFAKIPSSQVKAAFPKMSTYIKSLISPVQVKDLMSEGMSFSDKKVRDELFPWVHTYQVLPPLWYRERFAEVPASEIMKNFSELSEFHLASISADQMEELINLGLDISKLEQDQRKKLLSCQILKSRIDENKDLVNFYRERFGRIPTSQVQLVLSSLSLGEDFLISAKQMSELDFTKLDQILIDLFGHEENKNELAFDRERFSKLPIKQVQSIFPFLSTYARSLASDEQLQGFDLTGEPNSTLLFHYFPTLSKPEFLEEFRAENLANWPRFTKEQQGHIKEWMKRSAPENLEFINKHFN